MSANDESDDDIPQLSANTLLALQEFYKEEEIRNKQQSLQGEENVETVNFDENWQLSQFWYDDETVDKLTNGAANTVGPNGKIALISCPTLFKKMKAHQFNCEVTLFEFDKRFAVYGKDFHFYDYKSPLNVPRELSNYYDLVIADPPFLSDECLTKTSVTAKFLSKNKIAFCTGAVMENLIERLLNLKKCKFEPHHQNNLANEFWCYANFNFDEYIEKS